MSDSSISGTYFTVWHYQDISPSDAELGPIVVVHAVPGGVSSVIVDGVEINMPLVTENAVSWFAQLGNPSSGSLQFAFSPTVNAESFIGTYWLAHEVQPSRANLFGFATQPVADLATWDNTYQCFLHAGTHRHEPVGELVVTSPTIIFAGKQIINPIYTGVNFENIDTNELAWFTSDGNDDNVAVSFSNSPTQVGIQVLNGAMWPDGADRIMAIGSPATADNLFGTSQENQDNNANQLQEVGHEAHAAHAEQAHGVDLAVGLGVGLIAAAAAALHGAHFVNAALANNIGKQVDDGPADEGPDDDELPDQLLEDGVIEGIAADPDTAGPTKRSSSKPTGLTARQLLELRKKS